MLLQLNFKEGSYMSILEVLMIVCFGVAWPINLYNSFKSKSTKGKNLLFMSFIVLAYVFGILNKLFVSVDAAVYFYRWFRLVE